MNRAQLPNYGGLAGIFTPELIAELNDPSNGDAGIVLTAEAGASVGRIKAAATRLRELLLIHFDEARSQFAIREEHEAGRIILYRKDCRGLAHPSDAATDGKAQKPEGLSREELGVEWMRGHYDRTAMLHARLASPVNRGTFGILRDNGYLSPRFVAEAERILTLLTEQKEAAKPVFVWDRVLEAFRSGESPAFEHLQAIFRLKSSAIPAPAREELESFGIFLRVPAHSKPEPLQDSPRGLYGARPPLVLMDELWVESPPTGVKSAG